MPAGPDDVRLTHVQPDGELSRAARNPAAAYSAAQDLYLVAWIADDDAFDLVDGEDEVFVALFDPADSSMVSQILRVSSVAPAMDPSRGAFSVDVAWNAVDDTFLVVWNADDADFGSPDNQGEVYCRRVRWTALDGWLTTPTIKLSDSVGMPADPFRDASQPAVAWGAGQEEWLVVWRSDRKGEGLSDNESEIFGQRVTPGGFTVGSTQRLSSMGIAGDPQSAALSPDLAYQESLDRFFVVWHADDVGIEWLDNHYEVFGRFVSATDLSAPEPTIQISESGSLLSSDSDAIEPTVATSAVSGMLLVAWQMRFESVAIDPDKDDIWGVGLDSLGHAFTGQVRLGQMGDPLDPFTGGFRPVIEWTAEGDQFLIAWTGNTEVPAPFEKGGGGPDVDYEIWSRSARVGPQSSVGPLVRVSDLGGGSIQPELYDATLPAIIAGAAGRLLLAWEGDDDEGDQVDGEVEIFGELVRGNWIFVDGFESGSVDAWSP